MNICSLTLIGAVMGSVLFRLMVAVALRWGLVRVNAPSFDNDFSSSATTTGDPWRSQKQ
jgi:hypothetical protein